MENEVEGVPIIQIDEFGANIPGTGIRIDFKREPSTTEEVITTKPIQTTQQQIISFITNNAVYILVGIGLAAIIITSLRRK